MNQSEWAEEMEQIVDCLLLAAAAAAQCRKPVDVIRKFADRVIAMAIDLHFGQLDPR